MQRILRTEHRVVSTFAVIVLLAPAIAFLSGCASGRGSRFVREEGVPITVAMDDGSETGGTLVSYAGGALIVDRSFPKNERLRVVKIDDRDIVLLDGVEIGVPVEIREFDIVVRGPIPLDSVEEARVRTKAYYGWGTLVSAVLAYGLMTLLEDQ